jgi:hypothetical protein
LIALSLAVAPMAAAQAQDAEGARCTLIGPVAVSGWLSLLTEMSGGDGEKVAEAAGRAEMLTSLYSGLGCDVPAFEAALDCITDTALGGASLADVQTRAQACMRDSGMALR